jgi:hypothetical protein
MHNEPLQKRCRGMHMLSSSNTADLHRTKRNLGEMSCTENEKIRSRVYGNEVMEEVR